MAARMEENVVMNNNNNEEKMNNENVNEYVVTHFSSFESMNLPETLLRGVFNYGFESPSVIQQTSVVPMSKGHDLIAQSQSGTGKTGAFSIGLLQRIDCGKPYLQAIVLEPTRELARQSGNVLSGIGENMGAIVHVGIGGNRVNDDLVAIRKGVHVLVGTPGRVCDLMRRRVFDINKVAVLVLDEADEMLSAGFEEGIREVLSEISSSCQICLFSATLPPDTLALTKRFMRDPVRIVMEKEELSLRGIRQFYVAVQRDEYKLATLNDLFESVSVNQTIIFCNSRRKAVWLADQLEKNDYTVSCIHSDLTQQERDKIMAEFLRAESRVLIATDLIGRGIDVQGVSFVINFDLTRNFESYIHRIGRSGRFGKKGIAINFVTDSEMGLLRDLTRFYDTEIQELPAEFPKM